MISKILIIPARRHAIEAYSEYLIRYLSDEFYFEMGYPSEDRFYSTIRQEVWTGATSPLEKNPDEFDLIYPHFDSHWFLEPPEKYAHKIVHVFLEPQRLSKYKVALEAGTSKPIMEKLGLEYELRFGVDTHLFTPFPMIREDNLFHIGFTGNIQTPRRYLKDLFMPLQSLLDTRLLIFPTSWNKHTRVDEIESMGGQVLIDSVVEGDKWWSGFPNCYNQMDVFVRCDIDPGYQFSVLEAAACEVPVVTTDPGLGKELCDEGGGIYVECQEGNWQPEVLEELAGKIREAVELLKNNPEHSKAIGKNGRKFVEENYTWDKHIPTWREFFREGLKNAQKM